MKIYNICTPKKYEKDGEEKTTWLPVGSLRITEKGQKFIELNMMPNVQFMAFPREKNVKKEDSGANQSASWDE